MVTWSALLVIQRLCDNYYLERIPSNEPLLDKSSSRCHPRTRVRQRVARVGTCDTLIRSRERYSARATRQEVQTGFVCEISLNDVGLAVAFRRNKLHKRNIAPSSPTVYERKRSSKDAASTMPRFRRGDNRRPSRSRVPPQQASAGREYSTCKSNMSSSKRVPNKAKR